MEKENKQDRKPRTPKVERLLERLQSGHATADDYEAAIDLLQRHKIVAVGAPANDTGTRAKAVLAAADDLLQDGIDGRMV